MTSYQLPTYKHEETLRGQGYSVIAGVDEAGAGCWAGPVYAGAVIFREPVNHKIIRDSKTLSPDQRERAAELIKNEAWSWAVGTASAAEIDELNIRQAASLAMRRAVAALDPSPDFVLVDWFELKNLAIPNLGLKGGDSLSQSIAAASIIAKVERDRLMAEIASLYPDYGFESHKGYGTKVHQDALRCHGPCPEHRRSYRPVAVCLQTTKIAG